MKFDLYVQGFTFVAPDAAQYQISGSSAGNVQGRVVDRFAKSTMLSRSYTGATLRRQAHAFADDIVQAITGKKGIGQTKIAFKAQSSTGNGEIYVADFDGHNAQAITHDDTIVAAPAWVPGRLAIYYTSYKPGNPDIFYHNLGTGQRRVIAGYSGLNTSAAVSPDGSKVAMILSRSGSPNVWVCNADGTDLKQLTTSSERFVAVLVAGRPMDLFRDQNRRAARAGESAGGRRRDAADSDSRRAEPDRTRLVAGRQMDRVHVAGGRVRHLRRARRRRHAHGARGGRRPVVVPELADADFHAARGRAIHIICA